MKKNLSLLVSLILLIQAPSINADKADTLNAEGQKLIDQGKFAEALEAYKKAIKLKPDFWSPYRNAGWVLEYKLNKPQDALPYYFKAIELNPTEPISFLEIAATYMDLKNWELCAKYYIKAHNIYKNQNKTPMGSWIYTRLADILSDRLNKKNDALKYLIEGSNFFKNEYGIHLALANLYKNMENYTEAQVYYNKAVSICKNQNLIQELPWIYNNTASMYIKLKKYDIAKEYLDKALSINPKYTLSIMAYAWLLFFKGDLGGFGEKSEEFLKIQNSNLVKDNEIGIRTHLAFYYPRIDLSFKNAKRHLEYLIKTYPNHQDRARWEEDIEWYNTKKITLTGSISINKESVENNSFTLLLPINTNYQKHLKYNFDPAPSSYRIFSNYGNTYTTLKYKNIPSTVKYNIDMLLVATALSDKNFFVSDDNYDPNKYLSLGFDSNNSDLKNLVNKIISNERNQLKKAKLIYYWIYNNFKYKVVYYDSINEYIKNKMGDCYGYAKVFVILCRIAGIPARCLYSPIFQNPAKNETTGHLGSHVTSEFYIKGNGWIPVNNTDGLFGITSRVLSLVRYRESHDSIKYMPFNLKDITALYYTKKGSVIVFRGGDFNMSFYDWSKYR